MTMGATGQVAPVIALPEMSLQNLINAIIHYDPDALLIESTDEVLTAGETGWLTFTAPQGRILAFATLVSWGDASVFLKFSSNVRDDVFSSSYMPQQPVSIFVPLYIYQSSQLLIYRENKDLFNSAEYHNWRMVIQPLKRDWDGWWKKFLDEQLAQYKLEAY